MEFRTTRTKTGIDYFSDFHKFFRNIAEALARNGLHPEIEPRQVLQEMPIPEPREAVGAFEYGRFEIPPADTAGSETDQECSVSIFGLIFFIFIRFVSLKRRSTPVGAVSAGTPSAHFVFAKHVL